VLLTFLASLSGGSQAIPLNPCPEPQRAQRRILHSCVGIGLPVPFQLVPPNDLTALGFNRSNFSKPLLAFKELEPYSAAFILS